MFLSLRNPVSTPSARLSALQIGFGAALTLVLSLAAPHLGGRPATIASVPPQGDIAQQRQALADEMSTKVESLLDFTYGPGTSQVEVRVDLDESESEVTSKQYKGPERVTRETCLEESYAKDARAQSAAQGQTVESDDEGTAQACLPSDSASKNASDYRNVKRNTIGQFDETDFRSVSRAPRVVGIHCAVALKVPHREEQAKALVSGLLGLHEQRGDTLSLVCVPRAGLLGL